MKDVTWLRDYFTDAEINEYRYTILKKYFNPVTQKELESLSSEQLHEYANYLLKEVKKDIARGERKAESKLQRIKRRGTGKTKKRKS